MKRLRSLSSSALGMIIMATTGVAGAQDLAPPPPMQQQPQPQPGQPTQPSNGPQPPGPIAPPGPMTTDPALAQQGATNQKLNEAEEKDSGRNFELFWLDASLGGSYINMSQFSEDSFQIKKTSAGGPAFSVGAGVRFVILVLGARLRYNALSLFNLWQINAEAGLKIPVSSFDILFQLHGGYSFVGRLGDANQATDTSTPTANDAVAIRGFNGGLDVGFDYYVSPLFSVGAGVIGDFLFLNRPPSAKPSGFDQLTPDQKAAIEKDPIYQKSGTAIGLQLAGGLRLGLHFGL